MSRVAYRITVISIAAMLVLSVGVAVADTASIKSVETVDVTDNDGDGAVTSFSILITADTNCVGCNDEGGDDPNIEPTFYVKIVDEDGDTVELPRTEVVDNDDNLEYLYDKIPDELLEQYQAQTIEVHITLFDEDQFVGERLDEETILVDIERPADDGSTSTPTATPTSTPTPIPTPTETRSPEATPKDGDGSSNGEGEGEQSADSAGQDRDGDGIPDDQDYAPNDPDVQVKGDISQTSQPGFGLLEFGLLVGTLAIAAFGILSIARQR